MTTLIYSPQGYLYKIWYIIGERDVVSESIIIPLLINSIYNLRYISTKVNRPKINIPNVSIGNFGKYRF